MKATSAVIASIIAVMASCQSVGPRPTGEVSVGTDAVVAIAPTEWVLSGTDVSMYLRWTDAGGQLDGVAQVAERNADSTAVDVRSEDMIGATNGGQVVLTAQTQRWSGASSTDTLVLRWARADGAQREITLRVGTAADFDAAVASMRAGLPGATVVTAEASTTTGPAPPASGVAPSSGPSAAEVADAVATLEALQQGEEVADVEAALDVMETLAGQVDGDGCAERLVAVAAVQDAAAAVERRMGTVVALIESVEGQRAVVSLLGVAVAQSRGDPAVALAATDAAERADQYVEVLRTYGGDVASVVDDAIERARAELDDC